MKTQMDLIRECLQGYADHLDRNVLVWSTRMTDLAATGFFEGVIDKWEERR